MKKMKKALAVILSLAMVLGMSLTAFAANGVPEKTDKADVSITGIGVGATVKLYQIAEGVYGENGVQGFIDYKWVEGTKFSDVNSPTADEINAIAQKIKNNNSLDLKLVDTKTISTDGTYVYNALAGAYIAIIENGVNDTAIYNPILLTASYVAEGENAGNLEGHVVSTEERYIGTQAVAKKTTPNVDKKIVDGTVKDDDRETASVGDVITYEIKPTMPSYPSNATNKTLTFADTMSEGLTFVFDSLQISFSEDATKKVTATKQEDGSILFTCDEKEIAKAYEVGNGFSIGFKYDNLVHGSVMQGDDVDGMMITPGAYTPVIRYNAVLNDKAVVGGQANASGDVGNPNDARMYYANKPNTGSTFEPSKDNPEPKGGELEGIEKKEKKEIVYTYQLAFLKTGEGTDKTKLAGAVFGIYTDQDCKNLVDVVKTNDNGYAVSSKVKADTYYIKELLAPSGYTLNDKVYSITANKTSTTQTITTGERKWKYTTEKPSEDAKQIGWIDVSKLDEDGNGPKVFYALDEYNGSASPDGETGDNMAIGNMPKGTELMPAYAVYDNTSVTTTTTITQQNDGGTAAELIDTTLEPEDENYKPGSIPNTKLGSLPSTGGIGTTIFTIGGCAIMIIAAALFFASRRKSVK